jgi:hypothetical protein
MSDCKHRYVWPDGTCVHCTHLLVTTVPGATPRMHITVTRRIVDDLIELRRQAKRGLDFALADRVKELLESLGYCTIGLDGPPAPYVRGDR